MKHEEEMARAERLEAAARRAFVPTPKPKPDPSQTYHGRAMAGLDGDGAIGKGEAYVVGSQPNVSPPYPPSVWEADRNNIEPPLNEDISAVADMLTMPHGGSAFAAPEEIAPPAETAPTADADEGEE